MALNKRQMKMLDTLINRGVLDKPRLGSMKAPTQAPLQNRSSDYASYLLSNAVDNKGVAKAMSRALASNKSAEQEEQGIITQLFDTMLIPNYYVANVAENIGENLDDPWELVKGFASDAADAGQAISSQVFGRGLSKLPFIGDDVKEIYESSPFQQEKRTFSDNLEDWGVDNPIAKFAGGMALDIAFDPLTYVGVGLPGRFKKGKEVADQILDSKAAASNPTPFVKPNVTPKAPSVAQDALRGNAIPSPFNSKGVPELPKVDIPPIPESNPLTRGLIRKQDPVTGLTPGQMRVARQQPIPNPARNPIEKLERRQADWERAMTSIGRVTNSSDRINMSAVTYVVQKIQAGEVPKTLPKPPAVAGPRLEAAKDIADDFIDALMGQKKNKGKKLTWRGPDGKITTRKLPPELTAGMQISMFSKIIGATGAKNLDEGVGLLRAAEDHMISLGVHPIRHEGVRVRLSDVVNLLKDRVDLDTILSNFAVKDLKKMDPQVREAIQTVAAYRSVAMSDVLANLTDYAAKATKVSDQFVGRQKTAAEAQILDEAIGIAEKMGTTSKELASIKNLIKDVVNIDKLPAEKFYSQASAELMEAFKAGRISGDLIVKFNKAVASSYGYGYKPAHLAERVTGERVVDTMMGHFVTNWGKGNFLPKARGLFDAGMRNAQARAETMRKLAKNYSKDEIKNSWKLVNKQYDQAAASPREMELANFMRNYFAEVLRVPSYGMELSNAATKHLSVAERSVMLMDDINRHLKDMGNVFQFTRKPIVTDKYGFKRNFSDTGEGWQASWALWDPDDPLKFMFDVDLAMERATKEYAFLDNFVDAFGSLTKTPTHDYKMNIARIADFHVPQEVGQQMTRVMNDIHKGMWRPRTPLTRFYTKGLRIWKSSVTIYFPSHHIRNGIGDMYLMWMAGHNNPLAFKYSARILHSQKGRYQKAINSGDFETLRELTDPQAIKWAETRGGDVILNVNGTRLTADQIYVNAFQRGLLKDANMLEDIFGESRIGINPLGGYGHATATAAAEYREHFIRIAHFTSAVNKKLKRGSKDLQKVFDEAAEEVRKWHPDGTDLTKFEQKYMRQIVPFYSWIRKSTPLLVESLVTRPAKSLAYPRGMDALQNMLGIEGSIADPFPDDQLFPDWLRESGIGPIGDPQSDNPFSAWWGNLGRNAIDIEGKPYGYTFVQPGNPLIDQGRQFLGFGPRDTAKGLFESISPFLRVPIEMGGTGKEFTGAPIYKDEGGKGLLTYLMKQFGPTAAAQRYTNYGEDPDRVGIEKQGIDVPAIINNLTAAGIYGSGPYIKSAEFEAKAKAAAKEKERR